MASYTKIALNEVEDILKLYGVSEIGETIPLSLGISNSNYKVITKSKTYLLKISNDKGYEDLSHEQEILIELSKAGFPYSLTPYKTLNNENVYRYGNYFGVLFPFVEGIPPGPSDQTCAEIGKALATLHSLKLNNPQVRSHEKVGFGPVQIKNFINGAQCPADFREFTLKFFPDELQEYIALDLEKGIIHGDLYFDNTLFHNDHIAYLLDFEQSGTGEYLLDLGISISGSCLEKGRVSLPLIKSYVAGYESVRPLNKTENKFLNQSITLGLLSISLWRIKRFTIGNLDPSMKESYRDLLYRAQSFNEIINTEE